MTISNDWFWFWVVVIVLAIVAGALLTAPEDEPRHMDGADPPIGLRPPYDWDDEDL